MSDNASQSLPETTTGYASIRDRIFAEKARRKFPVIDESDEVSKSIYAGWEGVYVLELTPAEIEKYDDKLNDVTPAKGKKITWYERLAYWLAVSLVDESGSHIFNPENAEDVREIMNKIPLAEQQKIESRIMELNHLRESGEQLAKNS